MGGFQRSFSFRWHGDNATRRVPPARKQRHTYGHVGFHHLDVPFAVGR